jgi:hypothetical protein
MTREEKQLLLKDLSARLPYGVICDMWFEYNEADKITEVLKCGGLMRLMNSEFNFIVKPYLRPMSSMTEEEKDELRQISEVYLDDWLTAGSNLLKWKIDAKLLSMRTTFYNSHHFDWNDLIPMGLALEAPEGMYKEI